MVSREELHLCWLLIKWSNNGNNRGVPWRIGKQKLRVFPEPVSAKTTISQRSSPVGIASTCIEVGTVYPRVAHASHRASMMPSSAKVFGC